jgi:hypothetical protein
MNHLLFYDNFLNEYYDTFYYRIKEYYPAMNFAHKISTKYFTDISKIVNKDEINVIEWYRDAGYRQIVEFLFTRKPSYREDKRFDWKEDTLIKRMSILEEIINKSIVKKDVVVWKGLSAFPVTDANNLIGIISKLNIGDNYTFKNFFSTSLNFQYSVLSFGMQNDSIILKINLPTGSKAAYISMDKTENEVLLQRNQTIKLKDIYEYDLGKHYKRHQGKILKIYEFDLI